MRILGIDPGSRVLGFGLVEVIGPQLKAHEFGVIDASRKEAFSARLREIGSGLENVLQRTRPDVVVLEKIFLGKNVDSSFKLGHARGLCVYLSAVRNIPLYEYEARLIKKGITGNGAATKEQVALVTLRLLGLTEDPRLDASDALAMAVYHARNEDVRRQFAGLKIDPPRDLGEPL